MADYAPNYTARYRIRYVSLGKPHLATFRHTGPTRAPGAAFLTGLSDFLSATAPIRYSDWTITSAQSAAENSDIFLPESLPPAVDAGAATPGGSQFRPVFVSFQGQSDFGNRCSVYLFGIALDPAQPSPGVTGDYRINNAEDATTTAIVAALAAIPDMVAIDRAAPNWNAYMNIAYNAYYQRRARVS
jgi:hypothetical protein